MNSRRACIGLLAGLLVLVLAACTDGAHAKADPAKADPAKVFADPRAAELARAIDDDDSGRVRKLVQSGADLSVRGQADFTLVQWTMLRDRPRMLALLLDLGADPAQIGYGQQTALHTAAMGKKKPFLQILLDHGASPDLLDGRTRAPVLSEAVANRNHDAVRLLLAHHANPNLGNRQEETPLHTAALISDYPSMLALLDAGTDPGLRDKLGKTFLVYFNIQPKESLLSGEARRARQSVRNWLDKHGYRDLTP